MSTKASSDSEPPPQPYRPRLRDWPQTGAKVAVIVGWTATMAAFVVLAWALVPGRRRRSAARRARIRRWACRLWGRGILLALGVRCSVEGTVPPPGTLVVSNHLSYLDIPVLASVLPVVFVSKADVRRWPFWGLVATIGGTVFIDRTRRQDTVQALAGMRRAFDRGDGVAVFPEATSTSGATILPFKPSLLADAAARRTPVHWATIWYGIPGTGDTGKDDTGSGARNRVCWWGDMSFLPHVAGMCAVKRIHCRVRLCDSPIRGDDRKVLASALRRAMLREFEPVA